MPYKFDYRNARRLRPRMPIEAFLAGERVQIVDLAIGGLGILHAIQLRLGAETLIEFQWASARIRLRCQVARIHPTSQGFHSGLMLVRDESAFEYRKRVAAEVEKVKAAEAKMPGVLDPKVTAAGSTR